MFYLLKRDKNSSEIDLFERNSLERNSFERNSLERGTQERHRIESSTSQRKTQSLFNWSRFTKHALFWILVFLIPLALMQYSGR